MQDKYDQVYQIEGTTIYIVAPNISEDEKQSRLEETKRVLQRIWMSHAQLTV